MVVRNFERFTNSAPLFRLWNHTESEIHGRICVQLSLDMLTAALAVSLSASLR